MNFFVHSITSPPYFKHYETNVVYPYSSRASQQYQEPSKRVLVWDISTCKINKTNYLASFIDRLVLQNWKDLEIRHPF